MKKLIYLCLLFISFASIAEVSIIVHPSNTANFDKNTISRIFTGKLKSYSDGAQAIPINQKEGANITKQFNSKVLGKTNSQIKAYWSKLVFTGKGSPPKAVSSEQEVIDLIKNNPNLIGYISDAAVTLDVKVVLTF